MELACALNLKEIEVTPVQACAVYLMECGSCQEQCYPVKQICPARDQLLREKRRGRGWGLCPSTSHSLRTPESDNLWQTQAERDKLIKELDIKDASKDKCETCSPAPVRLQARDEGHASCRG